MRIALYHAHYNEDRLASVTAEMLRLGAPKVKAVWSTTIDAWAALEGAHRLRAASELGLVPVIEQVPYSATLRLREDLDLDVEEDLSTAYVADHPGDTVILTFDEPRGRAVRQA
jgi:hypothetical protein